VDEPCGYQPRDASDGQYEAGCESFVACAIGGICVERAGTGFWACAKNGRGWLFAADEADAEGEGAGLAGPTVTLIVAKTVLFLA
jgi:hypothetical protein